LGPVRRAPVHVGIIDKLPRNEMGKVARLVLKRRLIEARDASRRSR
jgi:acyl-coenzyme A synthetase/AMP-(fatty) acid ligase